MISILSCPVLFVELVSSPCCRRDPVGGCCKGAGALLYGCHCGFLFLPFFSCPQSMCEVLAPGLAVSVLKAIFQEVHVQVSNVISHPPLLAPSPLGVWGWPACSGD